MPGYSCTIKERMLYSSCKAPLIDYIENSIGLKFEKKVISDIDKQKLNHFKALVRKNNLRTLYYILIYWSVLLIYRQTPKIQTNWSLFQFMFILAEKYTQITKGD